MKNYNFLTWIRYHQYVFSSCHLSTDHLCFEDQNKLHKHVSKVVLWLSALDEYDIIFSVRINYSHQSTKNCLYWPNGQYSGQMVDKNAQFLFPSVLDVSNSLDAFQLKGLILFFPRTSGKWNSWWHNHNCFILLFSKHWEGWSRLKQKKVLKTPGNTSICYSSMIVEK